MLTLPHAAAPAAARLMVAVPLLTALLPPLAWLLLWWLAAPAAPAPAGSAVWAHPGSTAAGICLLSLAAAAALWAALVRPAMLELHESEQRLLSQGQLDPLTGALNRDGLRRTLRASLHRYRKKAQGVGVVVIDIDRFHLINDAMGQAAGDEVLRNVAERMRAVLRSRDLLARLVADRFVVQVTGLAGPQTLALVARNLLRAFEPACQVGGREMVLTPSIGTATASAEAGTQSVDELLKAAELALRAAKAAGGGVCRHFEPSLLEQHDLWLDMEHRLRHAAQTGGFALAFQGIVDARSEQVVAVEALLRWPEVGRPQTSPAEFVPVLEQTGLIVAVGRWVMLEACRQALKWLSQGAHGLVLSVNVSPRQFADAEFAGTVAAVLAQTGFPATRLQIEVTEGLLLDPSSDTLRKLDLLVKTGVRLAVDDFGIGHSSLAYLKTFPLHTLKIDRMFVRDLQQHARDRAIARAIIELGHSLGLKVTAEGVETAEQAQTLRELGCDSLQGFLFTRPVPALEFKKLLAQRGGAASGSRPHLEWSDTMAGLEHAG
jgi:diguanylate cyclase (GGDEF)-like protein